jgi:hypothetical protein
MRIAPRFLLILPALLALTGCMQVESTTVIEKDGSGTFAMTYTMSPSVAEAMADLEEMGQSGAGDMQSFDLDRDEIAADCEKAGLELKTFREFEKDGRKGVEVIVAFDDFNKLQTAFAGHPFGALSITKRDDGNYVLGPAPEVEMDEDVDEGEETVTTETETEMAEMDPEMMGKYMEVMGKLMQSASEFSMTARVTVPGTIVSHNASRQEGNTCIWEADAENMMMLQDMEPEIVFACKGLKIKTP